MTVKIDPEYLFNFNSKCLVRMSKDDIIDQYDIFPIKIGEGNDAVVYKAKEKKQNGVWRAVKKIHRSYIEKEEYLLTEIQILQKLDHPGVLKIFEVFDDNQYVFIVTELCEGDSLHQELRKRQFFPQLEAKLIFKKIIEIVAYCHHNKIIHRDLKLENLVFCSKDHTPQSLHLIDFGMSFEWKTNARMEIKNTFSTNKIVGTIYFMAPEVYQDTYDHRVDIWSAGVILFFLLTGELPFYKDTDEEILKAVQQRNVPYEKLRQKNCSNQVIQLVKSIFETESKRISVEQILKHSWLNSSDEKSLKQVKYDSHHFSQIPLKEFSSFEDYDQYYRQKIQELSKCETISNQSENNFFKKINWNNAFSFLRMTPQYQALKIYLSYRLGYQHSKEYVQAFNHFKQTRKEQIDIKTLYEHLYQEYQNLPQISGSKNNENITEEHERKIKYNQFYSMQNNNELYSVQKIYKELLEFFHQKIQKSIGYTVFVALICDQSEFNSSQMQIIKSNLSQNDYQSNEKNVLENEIQKIHKIVGDFYIQKKKISKNEYSFPNKTLKKEQKRRQLPQLTLNIDKDPKTKLQIKRSPKKTIKQNILESISPTFIRNKPIEKPQHKAPLTDRPKQNKLPTKQQLSNGFFSGIHKIISYF